MKVVFLISLILSSNFAKVLKKASLIKKLRSYYKPKIPYSIIDSDNIMGIWGLGIGDWGLGIGPNPQSPIPKPQSPNPNKILK